jgi:hypothetical protein
LISVFATRPIPPSTSAAPIARPRPTATPSPYVLLSQVADATPSSDIGPEPRNIQNTSRACTVPSRRCRTAPKDLKIAPCRMSVPTA